MATLILPPGLSAANVLSYGLSSIVFLDKSTPEIIKVPRGIKERPEIEVEKKIYERLSQDSHHCGLLRYLKGELYADGSAWALHLEYASEGQVSVFLRDKYDQVKGLDLQIRWIRQVGDALRHVHSKKVVHGDISCNNIFLDEHLDARLGDFAGSSIDGSELYVACSDSHEPPWSGTPEKADIFALGSVYYHIMTGKPPYHELPGDEIRDLYERGLFPETRSLGWVGSIIERCWKGIYDCMNAAVADIDRQSKVQ